MLALWNALHSGQIPQLGVAVPPGLGMGFAA